MFHRRNQKSFRKNLLCALRNSKKSKQYGNHFILSRLHTGTVLRHRFFSFAAWLSYLLYFIAFLFLDCFCSMWIQYKSKDNTVCSHEDPAKCILQAPVLDGRQRTYMVKEGSRRVWQQITSRNLVFNFHGCEELGQLFGTNISSMGLLYTITLWVCCTVSPSC